MLRANLSLVSESLRVRILIRYFYATKEKILVLGEGTAGEVLAMKTESSILSTHGTVGAGVGEELGVVAHACSPAL